MYLLVNDFVVEKVPKKKKKERKKEKKKVRKVNFRTLL